MSDTIPIESARYATAESETPTSMFLQLEVDDPETVVALSQHPEGLARDAFALKALRIGVLALGQARGQIDAAERVLGPLLGSCGACSEPPATYKPLP